MNTSTVAVIDYGVGNLLSVQRALEHCGGSVRITGDPAQILQADRVVLPGVGAFGDGMAELSRRGLTDVVKGVAQRGVPLLGICLGMQMLFDESEEFGLNRGLGIIPGRVIPVPGKDVNDKPHKIPHIGWGALELPESRDSWSGTLLSRRNPGDAVYFVHSFMAEPREQSARLADCRYGGQRITAAVSYGSVSGCQFHPEKSGVVGLDILREFLGM